MPNTHPNVIIVITDDQGYGDLACHGNPVALTPNMDRLRDESVRFTDFHGAPMCTPTRGQLLTGLDAARNGALNVSSGRTLMRADLPTMADCFRAGGYSTGLFGKWHLGDNYPYRPQDRGFDASIWFPSSHISSLPDYWENDYFDDVYCHNGTRKRVDGYCTEVFFDHAMEWIAAQQDADRPFFAYLPTNAPHYPLFVPEEDRLEVEAFFAEHEDQLPDLKPEHRRRIIRFLAMIRNVDRHLGRLRAFLDERGLADDTLLIFMTDNGSTFGPTYYNAGMRGGKVTLWEGGHRVPCFLHWPNGALPDGTDIPGLTQVQDLLPTLAQLCGLAAPDRCDGVDLTGVITGNAVPPEDRMLVVNYSRMPNALDYPTPDSPSFLRKEGAAVLWKHWRLLETTALYDLDSDPTQQTNVINDHPEIAAAMQRHLDAWWEDVDPTCNDLQRIIIGSPEENPMMLTACEWADVFVDQQQQVRWAVKKNGYWYLTADTAGTYEFELRRWPRESNLALTEACDATVVTDGEYPAGKSLPIARARLFVAGRMLTQKLEKGAACATFRTHLDAGPLLLHTWFDDADNQPLTGAYYVYVTRIDD